MVELPRAANSVIVKVPAKCSVQASHCFVYLRRKSLGSRGQVRIVGKLTTRPQREASG